MPNPHPSRKHFCRISRSPPFEGGRGGLPGRSFQAPKKRPKLCARTIRERDGNRCQYFGKLLRPDEGSLDHVPPRTRGGKDEWGNLVWSDKTVNAKKGNRLPHEAGLKLLTIPRAPRTAGNYRPRNSCATRMVLLNGSCS